MTKTGKCIAGLTSPAISATINQACAAVVFFKGNDSLRPFVKLSLRKQYDEMRAMAAGGAQPNLNILKIRKRAIYLPPLAEQPRIVSKVNHFMILWDELEVKIESHQATAGRFSEAVVAELAT